MFFIPRWQKVLVLCIDSSLFIFLSLQLTSWTHPESSPWELFRSPGFAFVFFVYLFSSYVLGAYEASDFERKSDVFRRLSLIFIVSTSVILSVHYLGDKERSGIFSRPFLIGVIGLQWLGSYWVRLLWRALSVRNLTRQKWLFLLEEPSVERVRTDLNLRKFQFDYRIVTDWSTVSLAELTGPHWNSVVVGAPSFNVPKEISRSLVQRKLQGYVVLDLVSFYERKFLKLPVFFLGMDWLYASDGFRLVSQGFFVRLKRLVDFLLSGLLLILCLPLLLILGLLIPLDSKGPVFFRQIRTGKNGRNFLLTKLRTMRTDAEKNGPQWAKAQDNRVTPLGSFLRKTRLDELPQLWNVIKGEMSLIGPRPERPEFNHLLEREIPFYQLRHVVRPGLTGWAQIHFPYGASVEDAREKLQYELWYIKNSNLWVDLQILLKTIGVVLMGRGR
ncbi:MAG: exopolysaccharide biosynthesis polyprenyl glycosylphosphotransferase [Bdellovibrio sp.]